MSRLIPVLLLLLAGSSGAQVASYTILNQRAPYTNPAPAMLTAQSVPRLGGTLRLLVPYSWRQRNGTGADYFLATGFTNPNIPIAPLGGFLFTSADVVLRTPLSPLGIPGTATMSIPIPNDVRLLGFPFFQQVFATSPSPRLSRGGHGVVGK